MATLGLYWWGHGRIWFMPMEKMEVITEEMAKRFFAEVEKHQKNEGRVGMGGNAGIRFCEWHAHFGLFK